MGLAVTDEHQQLARLASRWVSARSTVRAAREHVEADVEALPVWWQDLIGQGWHALHVPEPVGGAGYGASELALVVEALGHGLAPGPFVPTVLAAALLVRGADRPRATEMLTPLLAGEPHAVALDPTQLRAEPGAAGKVRLTGVVRPVDGGGVARWFVVGACSGESGAVQWWLVPAEEVEVTRLASVDATRRVAAVSLDAVTVASDQRLELDTQLVRDLAVTLYAAEGAGIARWCVDTAAEYAKVREQFGRPIGQFQGVKHRCAEMLVRAEQAQAAAWDAARAADGVGDHATHAAAVAGAVALDAAFANGKDAIQVLGGIGFTWEHDVHLYLKRAMAVRQLVGTPDEWAGRCARLVLGGTRREPTMELPAEAEIYRDRIRQFIREIADVDADRQHLRLVEDGYLHPHHPPPWGRDAGPLEQLVIEEELDRAGIRRRNLVIAEWVIPTLIGYGTAEQQQRWLPDTYRQRLQWCQLFSEPAAGSDLASLSTKAVRVDGGWAVTGQKVWTSLAQAADLGILLARTDPDAPRHQGITYFVVEMDQPGVQVRPLRELTGHALFNEVFLQDAFVPDGNVIGEVNDGWRVARETLTSERVSIGGNSPFRGEARDLLAAVAATSREADPVVQHRVGWLMCTATSVSLLGARSTLLQLAGVDAAGASAVRKLVGVELEQDLSELAWELHGGEAATMEGDAEGRALAFLMNRAKTIYGGTSEIQRNVIAERLLGLPRDPQPRQ